MKVKLAEALLRRKELNDKVKQLHEVRASNLFVMVINRQKVNEDLDEVKAAVPRVSVDQVTAAHDWYAKQLRLVDAAIQQANWTTELDLDSSVMADYEEPERLLDTEIPIRSGRIE